MGPVTTGPISFCDIGASLTKNPAVSGMWLPRTVPAVEPDGLTGTRVAGARKDLSLSQRTLAAELGVSLRTIQNYEAGRFVPYRHLDALSRLLGRSPSWLLYGHEEADADRVLTSLREQRRRLHVNLERLRELSEQLVDTVSRPAAPNRSLPHEE